MRLHSRLRTKGRFLSPASNNLCLHPLKPSKKPVFSWHARSIWSWRLCMTRLLLFLTLMTLALGGLTACSGSNGQQGQIPTGYPGLGNCAYPQIWNGTTCVTPATGPGGYVHYYGVMTGVNATKARDIVTALGNCRGLSWNPLSWIGFGKK